MLTDLATFPFSSRVLSSLCAWDASTDTIAAACYAHGPESPCQVIVFNPSSPQDYCALHTPGYSQDDGSAAHHSPVRLVTLEWSPAQTARTLLALTDRGDVLLWTLTNPETETHNTPRCINRWHGTGLPDVPPAPVYCGWLFLPPGHHWGDPAPLQLEGDAKSIVDMFPAPASPPGEGPWLRRGMRSIAVVTQEGLLRVWWWGWDPTTLSRKWRSCPPVQLNVSPLHTADVIWHDANSLRVLANVKQGRGVCALLSVEGDPTTGEGILQSKSITNTDMGPHQTFLKALFSPAQRGLAFVALMSDNLAGTCLQVVTYTEVNSSGVASGSWAHEGHRSFPTTHPDLAVVCYASDGEQLFVGLEEADAQHALYSLHAHKVAQQYKHLLPARLEAIAPSPNGTAVALALTGHNSLQVALSEPVIAAGLLQLEGECGGDVTEGSVAAAQRSAQRVLWSLLRDTAWWDVASTCVAVAEVLQRVVPPSSSFLHAFDSFINVRILRYIHATHHNPRPHYGAVYNKVQVWILRQLDSPLHRVVRLDLCVRLLLEHLDSVGSMALRPDLIRRLKARDVSPEWPSNRNEVAQNALRWLPTTHKVLHCFLMAVKTWYHGRQQAATAAAAGAAAAPEEQLDDLPLIRLISDSYFWKHCTQALTNWVLVASLLGTAPLPDTVAKQIKEMEVAHVQLKLVHNAFLKDLEAQGITGKELQTDDCTKALAFAEAAKNSFAGPCICYYRTYGATSWARLQAAYDQLQVPVSGKEELCGLLEAVDVINPSPRGINFLQSVLGEVEVLPDAPPPDALPPGCDYDADEQLLAQWVAERNAALGLVPEHLHWLGRTDVITGTSIEMVEDVPLVLATSDLVVTQAWDIHHQREQQGRTGPEMPLHNVLCGAWVDTAPLWGGHWKQLQT